MERAHTAPTCTENLHLIAGERLLRHHAWKRLMLHQLAARASDGRKRLLHQVTGNRPPKQRFMLYQSVPITLGLCLRHLLDLCLCTCTVVFSHLDRGREQQYRHARHGVPHSTVQGTCNSEKSSGDAHACCTNCSGVQGTPKVLFFTNSKNLEGSETALGSPKPELRARQQQCQAGFSLLVFCICFSVFLVNSKNPLTTR